MGFDFVGNALHIGEKLKKGSYIASTNGRFVAVILQNGKFALFSTKEELWSTPSTGDFLEMSPHGTLSIGSW